MKGFLLSAMAGTMSLVSAPLGLSATYDLPVAVPDSGGTLAMLGFGLLGVGVVYRLWRRSGSDTDI